MKRFRIYYFDHTYEDISATRLSIGADGILRAMVPGDSTLHFVIVNLLGWQEI